MVEGGNLAANTHVVSLGGLAKRKQKDAARLQPVTFVVRQTVQLDICWKQEKPSPLHPRRPRLQGFNAEGPWQSRNFEDFLIRQAGREAE